jgi:hypothetical protein
MACGAAPLSAATFYVGPAGNDRQPGTRQQPLATLEAARDAARKAAGGPHQIVLLAGDYFLARPLELDARDNGLTMESDAGAAATLYGGKRVTGWRRDGQFWSADLPGVKDGTWDFRALVVNGRMPDRARFPHTGTLQHRGTWNLPLLPAVGGFWERKPTQEELTTMPYDPKDIPPTLDVKNAEVRMYHMWNESLVGVARNDLERHALIFSSPTVSPAGAFGIKKYVIFNTREGMNEPGQWYLDRTAGRLVYWPLPGEEMATAKVIAPSMERVVRIAGNAKKRAERITLRGLTIAATTPPLKPASFGATAFEGAVTIVYAKDCVLERVEIGQVGGVGLSTHNVLGGRIAGCHIHHTGACAAKIDGAETLVEQNHIHHAGVYYPSAAASMMGGRGLTIRRNEIHDSPYSGLIGTGKDLLIEGNLIYRVMRELHDGAAIYGNLDHCVIRGNVVRDVVKMGEGYGVSAYYLDEGARDCIIERNVALGVARPTHNHIARNITVRDNVFIAERDMMISFQSSANCTFQGNTLFAPGQVTVVQPNGIKVWTDNVLFRNGQGMNEQPQAFTIDDAMPRASSAPNRKPYALEAVRVAQAPQLDGEITLEEWPGKLVRLDRDPSRQSAVGAPAFVKLAYDDQFLYVGLTVTMFEPAQIGKGAVWGKDDAAEICVAGTTPNGKPAVFVVRGSAGGTLDSVTDAGASAEAAAALGRQVRFAAKIVPGRGKNEKGWRGEWAIPLAAIGVKSAPGLKLGFNLGVYVSEFGEWHCWEGTLAENWRMDQAGMLRLK